MKGNRSISVGSSNDNNQEQSRDIADNVTLQRQRQKDAVQGEEGDR